MTNSEAISTLCANVMVACERAKFDSATCNLVEEALDMAIEALSAEPKTGKWIKRFDGNEWFWHCSACKEQWYEDDLYMGGNEFPDFCPNCGSYNGGEKWMI